MNTFFMPRGVRNNNPGNIRLGKIRWQGQKMMQSDPDFVEFATPLLGLRAMMRTLLTYYIKYNLDTVGSIVNRWAPPHENATDHYAHLVAKMMKVRRDEKIDVTRRSVLTALAKAIAWQENGQPPEPTPPFWYDDKTYDEAADLALASLTPA